MKWVLPLYALLIAVLIPDTQYLGGLINLQGITFFILYFIGIATALLVSTLLTKLTDLDKDKAEMSFILECRPIVFPTGNHLSTEC
jgi:ferrous iron transport protein B